MNTAAKGNRAELDAWEWLESDDGPLGSGWLVATRRKGRREKGPGDHLAYKYGERAFIVEVKESKQRWRDFPRDERAMVRDLAGRYNLDAIYLWRPAPSKPFELIPEDRWP
jgi:hypothetical protein